MRYVLNSPVLTGYGSWEFSGPISIDEARRFLRREDFQSAVGHESTAQLLSDLLGQEIPLRRRGIAMEPGDTALVFRLKDRLPEGQILSMSSLGSQSYEFGVLRRLS